MYGYSAEETLGRAPDFFIPQGHPDRENRLVERIIKGELVENHETQRLTKDGRLVEVSLSAYPLRDSAGRIIGAAGFSRDISERKADLERIRQLAEIVASAEEGIISVDAQGRITSWNRGAEKIYGYTAEEVLGRTPYFLIPEDHPDRQRLIVQRIVQGESVENYETQRVAKDGRLVEMSLSGYPLRDGSGAITGAAVFFHDITERKAAEDRMRRLAHLFEHAGWGLAVSDREGQTLTMVNQAFAAMHGYTVQELTGQPVAAIIAPGSLAHLAAQDRLIRQRGGRVFEITHLRKDGSEFPARVDVSAIHDAQGGVLYYGVTVQDLTEGKRQEREREIITAQLRQAQKMEALGTLAGGIAHDFNNILGAILGYTELAVQDTPPDSPAREDLAQVMAAADRARDLVKQILAFSRAGEQERRPLRLGLVAKEALKLLRASLPATVNIQAELAAGQDLVLADPTQMHQVLMNLCTNAGQAMAQQGGTLTVGLTRIAVDEAGPEAQAGLPPGDYLRLSVADTGPGMPPEVLERVFDPFFTTKGPGEGTGLGLSVVHGIALAHGGLARASSRPGQGSVFEVLLPRLSQEENEIEVKEEDLPRGSERIMVVDDEPSMVEVMTRRLEALGYGVATHTNSQEALKALRADPQSVDLLLTDLTMPGLTGLDLAREARRLRPNLPVIICTGYLDLLPRDRAGLAGLAAVLHKPVGLAALAQALRRSLDSPPVNS